MPGPPGLTKFARKTLFRFSGTKLNRLLIWHLYEGKPQGLSPIAVPQLGIAFDIGDDIEDLFRRPRNGAALAMGYQRLVPGSLSFGYGRS